jgi:hypothetical protein
VLLVALVGVAGPARAQQDPPDVLGETLDQAIADVQAEWYPTVEIVPQVSWTPEIPATVSRDDVYVLDVVDIHYLEDSDDAAPSASITYVVGTVVPDLTQRSEAQARGIVADLAFSLKASGDASGLVSSQTPAPEQKAPFGTTVSVQLEVPTPRTALVPDLVGLSEDDARRAVAEAGLTLTVASRSGQEPLQVADQTPAPNTELALRHPVTVDMARQAGGVQVPDLSGEPVGQVERTLTDLGLQLAIDPLGDGSGLASHQDPAPGALVDVGTTVTVAFARPIQPDDGFPWVLVGIGAAVLLIIVAGAVATHAWRRRRRLPPPRPPVIRFQGRSDRRPEVSVRRVARSDETSDVGLSLRPRPDRGSTRIEDVP